ncbi:MogA/MoaB family molybdenum cofactor biosynthesis protein [Planococcus salinus]|uniref:Molybdenum cofactor biosynthesis protein B n=1 Tax=Planococcus salinus TaxID=1848460 RepID=A0A3M8PBR9_9BACL|nr:MogA/MoaB family molybdenum cofactor biosynthesis protein [Planococcus salinus]RNF41166.1 MogA/MoaB family molybdenum cofactor biosynthesis protein [Planococcus salinus]
MSEAFQLNRKIRIAVMTVSDTRTFETDTGGALVRKMAQDREVDITTSEIVKDDMAEIHSTLSSWLERQDVDAIITTGGTGIAKRDVTLEAVRPFFEKELDGFGELFRFLSFTEDIGSKALLSRAAAGTASEKAIFVLPGSRGAVRLAMERLVLPELGHIVFELTKHHQSR